MMQKIRFLSLGFRQKLSALGVDRFGNVAIMFALIAIPLVGLVGLAVDFSRLLAIRSVAESAADSAALFAVKAIKQSTTDSKGGAQSEPALIADVEHRAQNVFDATVASATDGKVTSTISVQRNGAQFSATVSYNVTIDTTFSRVLGQQTMQASSVARTISSMPLFNDVSLLLDISQSMGLASTPDGAKSLFAATKAAGGQGCVFGCHVSAPAFGTAIPFSSIANTVGVPLRIDVLRDAVTDMITRAQANAGTSSFYRFGLYTMSYSFTTLAALSDDLASVKQKASTITLGYNDATGFGDTDYKSNIPKLLPYVIANGDGLSQTTAKQYVFIVTDGVTDTKASGCTSGHCTGIFDPMMCQGFKDRGAIVGVIYTTYLPVLKNPLDNSSTLENNYQQLVAPFASKIGPSLSSCASQGWYFEASDATGIHAAMEKMFNQIDLPPTLTQ